MGTHLLVVTRLIIEGNFPAQPCQGHLFSNSAVGFWRMGLNCFFKVQKFPLLLRGVFFEVQFKKKRVALRNIFLSKDVRHLVPSVCNNICRFPCGPEGGL